MGLNQETVAEALASIASTQEMEALLNELLTEAELSALNLRWELMQQLLAGKTQRAIAQDLGVSLCKVTRGNKILKRSDSISLRLLGGNIDE